MAPQADLNNLPVETLERIVVELDCRNVCNLRLTAPSIAAKASQGCFKTYFITKSVELSKQHLEEFGRLTQPDGLGCALQHLTIVGIVPHSDTESTDSYTQNTEQLLGTALNNLRVNSSHGCLRSLILDVKCRTEDGTLVSPEQARDWQRTWVSAGDTARIMACTVRSASIPVESLDLYGTVERCALSSDRLVSMPDLLDMPRLRSLSLTISAGETRGLEDSGLALSQHICRVLESMKLERLDLRWYNVRREKLSSAERKERRFFADVAKLTIPSLTSVSLRGMYTSEEALLSFLMKHPNLRRLSLEEMHLERGEFRPVFAHINEHLNLDSLVLNDLWWDLREHLGVESGFHKDMRDMGRLIQFIGPRSLNYLATTGGPTWTKRTGPETRETIRYHMMHGRIQASPKAYEWHRKRTLCYGPP